MIISDKKQQLHTKSETNYRHAITDCSTYCSTITKIELL